MHGRLLPVLLLPVLLALLAGCADEADPAPSGEAAGDDLVQTAPAAPEPPVVAESDFGWLLAAGAPGTGADTQVASSNAAFFEIPSGVAWLRVETGWTCVSPTCTLLVQLAPRDGAADLGSLLGREAAAEATGDGNVTLEVEAPEAGEWVVGAHSEGPTLDVQGRFRVSYALAQPMADAAAHAGH